MENMKNSEAVDDQKKGLVKTGIISPETEVEMNTNRVLYLNTLKEKKVQTEELPKNSNAKFWDPNKNSNDWLIC